MGPQELIEQTASEFQIKPGGVVASPTDSWELVQRDEGAEGELDALSVCSSDDEGEREEEGAKPTENEPAPRRRRAAFGAALLLVAAVACSRPLAVRAIGAGAGASPAPAPAPAPPVSCLEEALLSAAKYVEDVAPALSEAAAGLATSYNLTHVEEAVKGSVADAAALAAGLVKAHRGAPAAVAGAAAAFLKKQNATELGRAAGGLASGTLGTTRTFLAAQNFTRLSEDARSLFGVAADAVMDSAEAAAGALAAANLTGALSEALQDPETLPKVIAASALGVTGFAVGVPFIPGVTDNLLLGAAGAAFPFLYGNATK
eukprot:CAMPEP_0119265930 /NCGR_PEP_ID=MMETSP1329-20130426/4586_1 /TAXON_ID=114041 /ORGANISM="Genus nov. species nov., Strain RCC1024" /LENGTH=316 /DNA_ID=CAMNT_0007265787 /DNA_START=315 /DNA_END=1265 /DNA_ORIENTATION=+